MSNSERYIRLGAAVTVAGISCAFVSLYSWASQAVLRYETNGASLPVIALGLANHANFAFVIPVVLLFAGIWATRRGNVVIFELSVSAAWVFAFFWLAYGLFAWRVAQIPEIHLHE